MSDRAEKGHTSNVTYIVHVTDLLDRLLDRPGAERCVHCGMPRRGYGQINDAKVCHTDSPFPDCYRLVTVYHEPLGCRVPAADAREAHATAPRSAEQATDAHTATGGPDGPTEAHEHRERFWGDDPYLICDDCGQISDALSGRVITKGRDR